MFTGPSASSRGAAGKQIVHTLLLLSYCYLNCIIQVTLMHVPLILCY